MFGLLIHFILLLHSTFHPAGNNNLPWRKRIVKSFRIISFHDNVDTWSAHEFTADPNFFATSVGDKC